MMRIRQRLRSFVTEYPRVYWVVDKLSLLFIFGSALSAFWAFGIEPGRLLVQQVEISLPDWPADYQPLRIAMISDLHVGAPFMSLEKIDIVISTIQSENPDLVVLLGDYIPAVIGGDPIAPEEIAGTLSRLNAPLGVYGILGIHDWWLDGPRVSRALQAAGINMIDNDAVKIERPGGSFWLLGLGDLDAGNSDIPGTLAKLSDELPAILATHNPDSFAELSPRIALTLAGHTHGGQVYLPLVGRPAIPSKFGQRYALGHIVEDGKHLFVTTGLGTTMLPMRFGVPPEIVILTIQASRS